MNTGDLILGFAMILLAAVCGGAFGLQYTVMKIYKVENASLLSLFFATIVVPFIAVWWLLPGWTEALSQAGWAANLRVAVFGFGWGLGAITYAYAFNYLGMALGASIIKGLTIAVGVSVPLARRWDQLSGQVLVVMVAGIVVLLVGTALSGRAGVMRERELADKSGNPKGPRGGHERGEPVGRPVQPAPAQTAVAEKAVEEGLLSTAVHKGAKVFFLGVFFCLLSGVLSAFVNLGFDYGDVLEETMQKLSADPLTWKGSLIRWMPMYWGGMLALLLCMGGLMVKKGTWRNYFAPGSGRDLLLASSMGFVHFFAQIPYGIGAYYLGKLGTSVGWGVNIGMALIVAATLGFVTGEWTGVSRNAVRTLKIGMTILIVAMGVLAYANSLSS